MTSRQNQHMDFCFTLPWQGFLGLEKPNHYHDISYPLFQSPFSLKPKQIRPSKLFSSSARRHWFISENFSSIGEIDFFLHTLCNTILTLLFKKIILTLSWQFSCIFKNYNSLIMLTCISIPSLYWPHMHTFYTFIIET